MNVIFLIGIALNIVMAKWIRKNINKDAFEIPQKIQYLSWKRWAFTEIAWREQAPLRFFAIETYAKIAIIHSLVMFCIATFGGAIAAEWIIYAGTFQFGEISFLGALFAIYFFCVLPVIFIYVLQYVLLKLSNFKKLYSHEIFIATYVAAIFFWDKVLQ